MCRTISDLWIAQTRLRFESGDASPQSKEHRTGDVPAENFGMRERVRALGWRDMSRRGKEKAAVQSSTLEYADTSPQSKEQRSAMSLPPKYFYLHKLCFISRWCS